MDNIYFNYYPAKINSIIPIGEVTLARLIFSIKNPKKEVLEIFNKIEQATINKDEKLRLELKSKLYYFTPSVYIHKNKSRTYANIQNWTGLAVLDFDKLDKEYCIEFKKALFENYDFIIASWLSASRHGVRCLVSIPISKSVHEFKQYYAAIEREFSSYNGFDSAPKNCVLPMFMSYDKDILYRDKYTTWNEKYIEIEKPIIKQYIIRDETSRIEKIIKAAIDKVVNNGHPQLRAASYVLGGYIGGGHIEQSTAINIIDSLIESNLYLSKKASIYKKTARTMIEKGKTQPLYLK